MIYSNLCNKIIFETEIRSYLFIENIYSSELMPFDIVFQ